jgi:hypothetical protein
VPLNVIHSKTSELQLKSQHKKRKNDGTDLLRPDIMLSSTEFNDQKSIKSIDSIGSFGISAPLAPPTSFEPESHHSSSVVCISTCLSVVWQLLSVFALLLTVAGALSPNWINRPLSGVYLTFDDLRLPSALSTLRPSHVVPFSSSSSSASSSFDSPLSSSRPSTHFLHSGDQSAFLHPTLTDHALSETERASSVTQSLLTSIGSFGGCTGLTNELQIWPTGCRPTIRSALQFSERVAFVWYAAQLAQLLGIVVFVLAFGGVLISTCKQSLYRKSMFTIVGTLQASAGSYF